VLCRPPPCSLGSLPPQIVNERFWIPAWPLLELIQGTGRVLRRDVAIIKAFALDIIQRRRKQLAAEEAAAAAAGGGGGGVRDQGPVVSSSSSSSSADVVSGGSDVAAGGEVARDLLSLFMTVRGPDGKPLSTQQLIDTVINFIIAGRDTTAQVGCGVAGWSYCFVRWYTKLCWASTAHDMVCVVLVHDFVVILTGCAGPQHHTCEV